MKHLLLFLFCSAAAPCADAQSGPPASWCPPGATWTYDWAWWQESGTLTVRYARDTVVAGQLAQLLTRSRLAHDLATPGSPSYTVPMSSVLTRTVGDRVDVWANGQFYPLYDFAALPGAGWLTPRVVPSGPCPAELVQVIVDSVGTQQVAGRSLRWLRVHLSAPAGTSGPVLGQWRGRLYEPLGSMEYLQPQSLTCAGTDPGYIGGFTSFQATGWPAIGYRNGPFVLATALARATAAGFGVYPNPSTGVCTLVIPAPRAADASLQVCTLTGQILRRLPVLATRQLDVRGLPAGTYMLLLEGTGQPALAQRLVVQ
jgi:hypothetical protein